MVAAAVKINYVLFSEARLTVMVKHEIETEHILGSISLDFMLNYSTH